MRLEVSHSIVTSFGCCCDEEAGRSSAVKARTVVVVEVAQDGHVDVEARLARRLHEGREAQLVEHVLEAKRDLDRLLPAALVELGLGALAFSWPE